MNKYILIIIAFIGSIIGAKADTARNSVTISQQNSVTSLQLCMNAGDGHFYQNDYFTIDLFNTGTSLPAPTVSDNDTFSPHLNWLVSTPSSNYVELKSTTFSANGSGCITVTLTWNSAVSFQGIWYESMWSPEGNVASTTGSITDGSGNVFTFGTGTLATIYKNGVSTSGQGYLMVLEGGSVYALSSNFNWWQYNGTGWTQVSSTPNFRGSLYAAPTIGTCVSGCTGVFSFGSSTGSGYHLLLNNSDTTGIAYFYAAGSDGSMYAFSHDTKWYKFGGGTTWTQQSSPPGLAMKNVLIPGSRYAMSPQCGAMHF